VNAFSYPQRRCGSLTRRESDYRGVGFLLFFRKQKSSPDKSDELLNMIDSIIRSLNLTYLPWLTPGWNWHLFPAGREEVVKASSGHYPLPFLISNLKELMQRNEVLEDFPKKSILKIAYGCLFESRSRVRLGRCKVYCNTEIPENEKGYRLQPFSFRTLEKCMYVTDSRGHYSPALWREKTQLFPRSAWYPYRSRALLSRSSPWSWILLSSLRLLPLLRREH